MRFEPGVKHNNNTLSEIQFSLENSQLICLKDKPKDLAELIARILYNNEETFYIEELEKFKNKLKYKVHCSQNRRRTVEDCYLCAKYYCSNISYKDVYNLAHLIYNNNPFQIETYICRIIKKQVHHPVHHDILKNTFKNMVEFLRKSELNVIFEEAKVKEKESKKVTKIVKKKSAFDEWYMGV